MHHNIRAVFDGPQKIGGGKSIVYDQGDPVCMGNLRDALDIYHVGIWVAERFRKKCFGIGADGGCKIRRVVAIHKGGFNSALCKRMSKEVVGAAIN